MEKVLIIDQDPAAREVLSTYFRDLFEVVHGRLDFAVRDAQNHRPSIIIFSLEKLFPLKQIVPELRALTEIPGAVILAIVSDANPMTLEFLYECGVDDYFVRPVDFVQLYWKIKFLKKRNPTATPSVAAPHLNPLKSAGIEFSPESGELLLAAGSGSGGGIHYHLTPIQGQLLSAFMENPDRLITREWLKMKIWPNRQISLRSIDAHISKLRALDGRLNAHIEPVYAKGYIWRSQPKRLTG